MHIAFVIFKNVVPAAGSSFLVFTEFQNFANDMQIEIACIFSLPERLLEPLGVVLGDNFLPSCGKIEETLHQLGATLGHLETNLDRLKPT